MAFVFLIALYGTTAQSAADIETINNQMAYDNIQTTDINKITLKCQLTEIIPRGYYLFEDGINIAIGFQCLFPYKNIDNTYSWNYRISMMQFRYDDFITCQLTSPVKICVDYFSFEMQNQLAQHIEETKRIIENYQSLSDDRNIIKYFKTFGI